MIRSRILFTAALMCVAVALSAETLPGTEGENLLGQKVKIAESLSGKIGVLLIGFSKASGDITAAWGKRLSPDFAGNPAVTIYQVPMLGGAPGFIRGTIVKGIKKDVPAKMQANFIVVVKDEDEWRRVCGYQKGADAYVLIVDKDGVVRQHIAIDATFSSYSSVHEQIEKLIPR